MNRKKRFRNILALKLALRLLKMLFYKLKVRPVAVAVVLTHIVLRVNSINHSVAFLVKKLCFVIHTPPVVHSTSRLPFLILRRDGAASTGRYGAALLYLLFTKASASFAQRKIEYLDSLGSINCAKICDIVQY